MGGSLQLNRTGASLNFVVYQDFVVGFDIGQHKKLIDVGQITDVVAFGDIVGITYR